MLNEKIYRSNLPIKYVFEEGNVNKEHLLIVFSGFAENTARNQHQYNYMRTLKNFDCNKLFILDHYGETGCYYLGENMNYEVESSVLSLITSVARREGIGHQNIILAGSSKGGTAALYFGLKYNFGGVIAGAFQTRISNYIKEHRPEAYDFMVSGDQKKEERLNNLIYYQLDREIQTKLFFISSENDWQHPEHIKPFLGTLDQKRIPYSYYECKEMKNHSDIGNHFPDFLIKKLFLIIHGAKFEEVYCNLVDKKKLEGYIKVVDEQDIKFKFIVKLLNQVVYENQNTLNFTPKKPGFYEVFLQAYKGDKVVYEKGLLQEFIGAGYYTLKGIEFSSNSNFLRMCIDTDSQELTYAFYIYKNGSIIEKIMYQQNNTLDYSIDGEGTYQIQYYIRDKFGNTAVNKTSVIRVN